MLFECWMIEESKVVEVYAIDTYHDRFLINYNGKFRWFDRCEFRPFNINEEIINIVTKNEVEVDQHD